ncbi:MAG: DUF2207 domain-containing protein [Propionibacteriaceae bacterium]|nr:DUF2207 domain-containing protein [Propionibacteriaceae bacterium]
MDALNWLVLMVGAGVLLVALLLRASRRPPVDDSSAQRAHREAGLIQPLPANAPPPSASPAMYGLLDEHDVGARELAITLLDLAGRGFLRIQPLSESDARSVYDWTLHRTEQPASGLLRYETTLLEGLFATPNATTARTLASLSGADRGMLDKTLDEVRASSKDVGWLTGPRHSGAWGAIGGIVLLLGLIAIAGTLFGVMTLTVSWQSLAGGACLVIAGVLLAGRTRQRPAWTPAGEAAQRQIGRYRAWLSGLQAHKIQLQDASSTLNQHLASAFALGTEKHLGIVLDQLTRRANSWSQQVTITAAWLTDDHPAWADGPLAGQIVALAERFITDTVRVAERAGVGLVHS